MYTIDELWQMEADQLIKERRENKPPDPDIWRWSPFDIREFAEMLNVAWHLAISSNIRLRGENGGLRRISIAEAGSGIGTKLYLMRNQYDMIETGYEINDEYLVMSDALGVHAVKQDLRELEPSVWALYDIIYLARPFKADESDEADPDAVEVKWERSVMEAMRPGAVLISTYAAVKPYSWYCAFRAPFRGVWQKPDHHTEPKTIAGKAYRARMHELSLA
jgi:hypothetical protein